MYSVEFLPQLRSPAKYLYPRLLAAPTEGIGMAEVNWRVLAVASMVMMLKGMESVLKC
jgi:hypothetical protein